MKSVFCVTILFCFVSLGVSAQYYYQDIYNAKSTMEEHARYVQAGVHHIRIRSFDAEHSLDQNFDCTKELSPDFREVITQTKSFQTGRSAIMSFFDDSGRITSTVDSSSLSVNITRYFYDSVRHRQIDSLVFTSFATKYIDTFKYSETHHYSYHANGSLSEMIRKKNGLPYSVISIALDSLGRVIRESERGQYDTVPTVYYKYNGMDQLTDIFHYNPGGRRMEPDYLFDYDPEHRLKEKTTVIMNNNSYLLWRYFYSDKGLISKEECYGKKHVLQGTMEFKYTY